MSSLETIERPAELLDRAAAQLAESISDPDRIPDGALRALIANALRIYAVKAEAGMRAPLPPDGGGLTITDTMIAVTDLLHALNVQVFELSMWQAMTGNCIAPHQRIDAPHP
jgi:hypothetical protein